MRAETKHTVPDEAAGVTGFDGEVADQQVTNKQSDRVQETGGGSETDQTADVKVSPVTVWEKSNHVSDNVIPFPGLAGRDLYENTGTDGVWTIETVSNGEVTKITVVSSGFGPIGKPIAPVKAKMCLAA